MAASRSEFEESLREHLGNLYTGTVVEHSLHPRNLGSLESPDGYARFTGDCGDSVELWLNVRDGMVRDIAFTSDGCSATIAAVSMMTELTRGKNLDKARGIRPQDVLEALGGLPPGNMHCAQLAVDVLRQAILDHEVMQRDPWKKPYRRYG
ncbi:MAG: iron-sulfur cluster assembly scaffold protein [Chloroflexota bacterium]